VEDERIQGLARAIAARPPRMVEVEGEVPSAAVALLVRPVEDDLELLLIRRAEREGDPWSGHMALPGGRAAPGEEDDATTAARQDAVKVQVYDIHGLPMPAAAATMAPACAPS